MSEAKDNGPAKIGAHSLPHKALVDQVQGLWREVDRLWKQWVEGSLSTADPDAADLDSYVKPLITMAELLRRQRMPDVSRRVYERAIEPFGSQAFETLRRSSRCS